MDAAADVAADLDTNAQTHQTHQYTSVLASRCANALTRSHQHTASNEYAIYSTYLNTSASADADAEADRHPDARADRHADADADRYPDARANDDPNARADRHADAGANDDPDA